MKLFLHINTKKIATVIPYVDNYLWNVGIQKKLLYFPIVVLPEKEVISYCCSMNGSELNIVQDSVKCVETL